MSARLGRPPEMMVVTLQKRSPFQSYQRAPDLLVVRTESAWLGTGHSPRPAVQLDNLGPRCLGRIRQWHPQRAPLEAEREQQQTGADVVRSQQLLARILDGGDLLGGDGEGANHAEIGRAAC